ncbi:MAG: hypothetical protein U5K69_03335 [Balneolaceae bacterium]|nr:hypothetical protein [Balneolaceae bacterium]
MTILFIGKRNLKNDAIREIVRNELELEMEQMLPEQFLEAKKEKDDFFNRKYTSVVADIDSFDMSQIEVTLLIRKTLPATRLVVINKYTSESLNQPLLEVGANQYLRGNFSVEELVDSISKN